MARIVLHSWGSLGDVYPYAGVALALRSLGHQPVMAVPAFYRPFVSGLGIEHVEVGPEVDPNDRALIARAMDARTGSEVVVREMVAPAVRRDYDALRPAVADADLVVTHPVAFAGPLAARAVGRPWVSTVLAPLSFFSATDPPVPPPAPWLIALLRASPWVARLFTGVARRATIDWVRPVEVLREELGLPSTGHPLFEGQFAPTTTLALFSRVLATRQSDWPAGTVVTGFPLYNGPDPLPPEVAAFLDAGEPPVVFTLGSSAVGAAGGFYEQSLAAVERLGVRAVFLTGGYEANLAGASSSRVLWVDRAPHRLLFPRASVVVHHGGVGTLGQALASGRPMLVVPFGHDQPDNAYRVTRLGVARTLPHSAYSESRVVDALRLLLDRPDYARRATAVAADVASEGGAAGAARAIDGVLTGRG